MSNLPWIDVAEQLLGTKELPGPGSNPVIIEWAKATGSKYYTSDDIPWCGLFVGYCTYKGGCVDLPKNILWARDWAKFGVHTKPCFGSVLVFGRGSGGHVGFYVGEDRDTYHVLGGNQSDMVCVTRVRKDRLLDSRWPANFIDLKQDGAVEISTDGSASISENEA